MKKIFSLAAISFIIFSCNDNTTKTTETSLDTTMTKDGTVAATTVTTYTSADGDVTYKEGKLMIYENGSWKEAEKDVVLDDGTVVTVKGEAKDKNGKTVMVSDGGIINKTGKWFDKAGNAIANAWDDTKDAVKEGAHEVKQGAEKAGEKIKETVN